MQHVDFQIVDRNQAITVDVPVETVGEAHDVAVQGGQILLDVVTLTVNATPATIPSVIEIDISSLQIGDTLHLSDVTLPEGVTCDLDPETVMVTAFIPRVVEDEVEETEAVEGEAVEGDAAAEGGDAASEAPADSDGE